MMPGPLHPQSSSTKIAIVVVVVIALLAAAILVLGKGGSLFHQNVQTKNITNDETSNCIGSSTELVSESGAKRLSELTVGDKILSYDSTTGESKMSTIYWIRVHDMTKHYRITTTTDVFTLSSEHLVLLQTGEYVRTRNLKVNDNLFSLDNESIVTNIDIVEDVAMSPIVLEGKVVMPNSTVVSCWSGTSHNADKMDSLMKVIGLYTNKYEVAELSDIIEKFYMSFLENDKDMTKVSTILKSLNMPITCK